MQAPLRRRIGAPLNRAAVIALALAALGAQHIAGKAADTVTAATGSVTIAWTEYEPCWKTTPQASRANFANRKIVVTNGPLTLQTVILENRYLRATVVPEAGGSVNQVIHKPSGGALFYESGRANNDIVSWIGGIKASFPYKEHGIRLPDQPASWMVVRHADGGRSVLMWMEFSRFNSRWNEAMFGRYSNMFLQQRITLRPNHARLDIAYRIVNPAPYRQGRQFWNDAHYPKWDPWPGGKAGLDSTDALEPESLDAPTNRPPAPPTAAEWILPASHVSGHCGDRFRPLDPAELRLSVWTNTGASVFAWAMPYGFAGLWYPDSSIARLRLADPAFMPGAKLFFWSAPNPIPYTELWTGSDSVFEQVESWIEPGEMYEFPVSYAMTHGIGKPDYADENIAVHVAWTSSPPRLETIAFRPIGSASLLWDDVRLPGFDSLPVAEARSVPLPSGTTNGTLQVRTDDGDLVLEVRLPLRAQPNEYAFQRIRDTLDPSVAENQERTGNSASMGRVYRHAIRQYPPGTPAKGRVLYRDGQIDAAIHTLEAAASDAPCDGEAWHLLGAARLEKGMTNEAVTAFRNALSAEVAYPPARYFLALHAIARGDPDEAADELHLLLDERPRHWEGRLLDAWLRIERLRDGEDAIRPWFSEYDMADPRVVFLFAMLAERTAGRESASAWQTMYRAMMREPGAARRLEEFQAATCGRYLPPLRMQ